MCRKISASVNGGRAERLACADPGARAPIGASGDFCLVIVSILPTPKIYTDLFYNYLVILVEGGTRWVRIGTVRGKRLIEFRV